MDDDNIDHYTISVRFGSGDTTAQIFNSCTEVDWNDDQIEFKDRNGKHQQFKGVAFHIAEE
jgi:hypothetical protein